MSENTKIITNRSDIVAIADAVRNKTGTSGGMTLAEIPTKIRNISNGVDTSDATATASQIFEGETAYTADGKVTGTFTIEEELTEQDDLITRIQTVLQNKAKGDVNIDEELATQDDLIAQIQIALNNKINSK